MKTYRVTCRGVKQTFIANVQATTFVQQGKFLYFYKEQEVVAVFKKWVYFAEVE